MVWVIIRHPVVTPVVTGVGAHKDRVSYGLAMRIYGVAREVPGYCRSERDVGIVASVLPPTLIPCHRVDRRVHRYLTATRQLRDGSCHAAGHRVHKYVKTIPVVSCRCRLPLVHGLGFECKLPAGKG